MYVEAIEIVLHCSLRKNKCPLQNLEISSRWYFCSQLHHYSTSSASIAVLQVSMQLLTSACIASQACLLRKRVAEKTYHKLSGNTWQCFLLLPLQSFAAKSRATLSIFSQNVTCTLCAKSEKLNIFVLFFGGWKDIVLRKFCFCDVWIGNFTDVKKRMHEIQKPKGVLGNGNMFQ